MATKTCRLLPPWRVLLKRFFEPCKNITVLLPRQFWFLILFSFCLLTVIFYSHFKQSTHAQKSQSFILFLSIIYLFFFVNKRHTHAHTKSSLGMLIFFFNFFIVFCLVVCFGVNLFVTISFCTVFVSRSCVAALLFQRLLCNSLASPALPGHSRSALKFVASLP